MRTVKRDDQSEHVNGVHIGFLNTAAEEELNTGRAEKRKFTKSIRKPVHSTKQQKQVQSPLHGYDIVQIFFQMISSAIIVFIST